MALHDLADARFNLVGFNRPGIRKGLLAKQYLLDHVLARPLHGCPLEVPPAEAILLLLVVGKLLEPLPQGFGFAAEDRVLHALSVHEQRHSGHFIAGHGPWSPGLASGGPE